MPYSVKSFAYVTEYSTNFLSLSKGFKKVVYISNNRLTVESAGIKPDCKVVMVLLSRKKLNKCLCTIFSNTLPTVLRSEIGL